MLTLLVELVNVQLPSLLLGVSVVFSSYLCFTHFASLSLLFTSSSPLSFFAATAAGDKRAFALSSSLSFFSSAAPSLQISVTAHTPMDDGTPLEVLASSSSSPSSSSTTSTTTLTSSTSATTTTTTTAQTAAAAAKRVSKAKLLRLGSSMGLAVPLALTRRAWKGAAYASWSVGFEVQHEMGQALLRNHHRFSLTDLCQLSADFAADPPAETSSIRIVYCGGIRADMVQYRSPFAQRQRPNNDKNQKKKLNDGRHLENRAILSKSESDSRGGKVAYRSAKSHEGEEVELKNLSKSSSTLSTSPTSSSPSSTQMDDLASTTRVKLSKRRIKSENDNLGRDNQFRSTSSGGDASVRGPNGNVENGNGNGEEDEEEPAATVLYLHGGGFCVGSSTTYRRCLWHFSREMKGLRFLAVDYSLSPHVRFPTALQECLHAYLWYDTHIARHARHDTRRTTHT